MTETKTRTATEQREIHARGAREAIKQLDEIRGQALTLSRRLADLVDEIARTTQSIEDSVSWLEMEPDAIHDEIAGSPSDFPPVA
jgi:hypothetical protein